MLLQHNSSITGSVCRMLVKKALIGIILWLSREQFIYSWQWYPYIFIYLYIALYKNIFLYLEKKQYIRIYIQPEVLCIIGYSFMMRLKS